jgi:hypothetical protein
VATGPAGRRFAARLPAERSHLAPVISPPCPRGEGGRNFSRVIALQEGRGRGHAAGLPDVVPSLQPAGGFIRGRRSLRRADQAARGSWRHPSHRRDGRLLSRVVRLASGVATRLETQITSPPETVGPRHRTVCPGACARAPSARRGSKCVPGSDSRSTRASPRCRGARLEPGNTCSGSSSRPALRQALEADLWVGARVSALES